jgi:hypothetical protein
MTYNYFRKNKFFVGSGILEAGCKSVIGQKLKQSGMHWSLEGATSVIALLCCMHSNQREDLWEKGLLSDIWNNFFCLTPPQKDRYCS